MKPYVFRDIWTGKIYKTHAQSARDAKWKIAKLKGINSYNLAHVRAQDKVAVQS